MPDTIIDPQDVVDAWGAYYLDAGQNMENLHMLPFESYGTQEAGTVIETNDTILREANVEVQDILQQYQDEFTPKGGFKMKPVEIMLYPVKIDVKFNPSKLARTWAGFLTSNKLSREDWPIVKWMIEKYIFGKVDEEIEMKAVYTGVYEAPEEGVPGVAEKSINGIEFLLKQLEANDMLDPITTGAIPVSPSDFVTQVENFIRAIPEKYRYNYAMDLNMNRTLRDKFKQGMRDKYNVNYQQTEQLLRVMDFENVTIAGRASMQGKNRFWMTPKFNLLFPTKGFSNKTALKVEAVDRFVKIWGDWHMGAGYIQPELIWENDQD